MTKAKEQKQEFALNDLHNTSRPRVQYRRVGRGLGSGLGKTCGRGQKGAGARAGYKRRYGYEGGQMRLFMKLPVRGFTNMMFKRKLNTVNLTDIEAAYENGEVVNMQTLAEKGLIKGRSYGVKLLANGQIKKKVKIEEIEISKGALEKLKEAKIEHSE